MKLQLKFAAVIFLLICLFVLFYYITIFHVGDHNVDLAFNTLKDPAKEASIRDVYNEKGDSILMRDFYIIGRQNMNSAFAKSLLFAFAAGMSICLIVLTEDKEYIKLNLPKSKYCHKCGTKLRRKR